MKKIDNDLLKQLANCIRFLSIDAVQAANSGHPGMPMGMADVATVLFTEFLKFNPKDPRWLDRDRFVLSAGHGSMLLYSLLYLTGYDDIKITDFKKFRQLHSHLAGHPEYGELAGIEATTGPLGQGVANSVGMALAEKLLAARLGNDVINHKIYCLAGDGCLMEGISQEAISFAGNLSLNNLVVLWDNNSISIDGNTALATCENMKLRFEACGWEVIQIDGHDIDQIRLALVAAQKSAKPVMIDCKTIIAYGSPNKAGSEKSHGSPLGVDEILQVRKKLNWQYEAFTIPQELENEWKQAGVRSLDVYNQWQQSYNKLDQEKLQEVSRIIKKELPKDFAQKLAQFKEKIFSDKATQATRKSSHQVLEFLTGNLAEMIGGSADLTESVLTKTSHTKAVDKANFANRYIHYGIREHAMAAIMNGLVLHSNFLPYGGTFLVFSDYMRPAIRMSALMKLQVIYVLTHDSIGLGEDGPTHQPIEHVASLRSIPNLYVFRPCDVLETLGCYEQALKLKNSPSAMVLSRQELPFVSQSKDTDFSYGAYALFDCAQPDVVIMASGSEVAIAVAAKSELEKHNLQVRIISAPCLDLFAQQSKDYQKNLLGDGKTLRVAIEAGIGQSYDKYLNENDIFVGMSSFGASAKASDLYKHFGITAEQVVVKVLDKVRNS